MNTFISKFKTLLVVVATLGALIGLHYLKCCYLYVTGSPTQLLIDSHLNEECEDFTLVDPNKAPEDIRSTVLFGYEIMLDTPKHAPDYVGNSMSCTNCHFCAGNTSGGKNGSISLAGIASVYPTYSSRAKSVVTLPERINGCFMRSMNGHPLPLNSPEMKALITYLQWISKDFPIYRELPWRGLSPITIDHKPDADNGKKVFEAKCALCHGKEGEGQIRVPPLWGDKSYNDGAGMNNIGTFAAFVHANMPFEEPSLTEEQALDVAAFVNEQARPHYQN